MSICLPLIAGASSTSLVTNDPYFANVVFLCHCDGTNGATTFTNVVQALGRGGTITAGAQTVSTTNPLFGTGCMLHLGSSNASTSASSDYAFGTANFTIEFAQRTDSPTQVGKILMDWRSGDPQIAPTIYMSGGAYFYYANGANRISSAGTVSTSAYDRVAYSRVGTTGYLANNGTVIGSWADNLNYNQTTIRIGANYVDAGNYDGKYDEFRVTNGVGRFTSNYIVAPAAFPDHA